LLTSFMLIFGEILSLLFVVSLCCGIVDLGLDVVLAPCVGFSFIYMRDDKDDLRLVIWEVFVWTLGFLCHSINITHSCINLSTFFSSPLKGVGFFTWLRGLSVIASDGQGLTSLYGFTGKGTKGWG